MGGNYSWLAPRLLDGLGVDHFTPGLGKGLGVYVATNDLLLIGFVAVSYSGGTPPGSRDVS